MHDLLLTAVENSSTEDGQPSMSVLLEILHKISEHTDSYGCILWQEIPPEGGSGAPQLFVLADWTADGRHCASHDLSIAKSFTGRAITKDHQFVVKDVARKMKNRETFDAFLKEAKIETFCATPVRFLDGRRGALNIYRNIAAPYDVVTTAYVALVAPSVPLLYEMIRTRVSSELLRRVTEVTRSFSPQVPEKSTPYEHAKNSIGEICGAVAKAFNCLEVSVFFEDRTRAEGDFSLVATTDESLAKKTSYKAGEDYGITGWTLAHPEVNVRIFDLANAAVIAKVYKGMHWMDSWQIVDIVRARMVPPAAPLPPLSFMAAPILRGRCVVGVIRCSVAKGPWYFAPGDHLILQMVASHLGTFWGTILDRREVDIETKALKELVDRVVHLNNVADTEITKSHVDDQSILTEALRTIRSVIPGSTITDFRLLNREATELRFAGADGGAPEEVATPQYSYPLDGSPGSAGSYVVHTGEVCVIDDVAADLYYAQHYPGTKRMMVAPIQLRDSNGRRDLYGVLDVCSKSAQPFPVFARDSAMLLSSQLALYKKLGATVRNLNDNNQVHIRLTEDMAHQLMSPLLIAKGRVQESLRAATTDPAMTDRLLEVRGAIGRALHVCSNLDVFVRLERGREVPVMLEDMTGGDLIAILINTSKDAARLRDSFHVYPKRPVRSLWDGSFTPRRRLDHGRIDVKREGFEKVDKIRTDRRLLEQVLTQVLDNAFKYSYVGSTVEVEGGYTAATRKRDMIERQRARAASVTQPQDSEERRRRIRISVINEGIDLTEIDAKTVTNRGVQAEHAQRFSQGGSGIGLWIVRELMKVLGGELEIRATDGQHRTEITLLFPVE